MGTMHRFGVALAAGLSLARPAAAFEEPPGTTTWNAPADQGAWDCAETEDLIAGTRPGPTREWLADMFGRDGCRARMVAQGGGTHQPARPAGTACAALGREIADLDKSRDLGRAQGFEDYRRSCLQGASPPGASLVSPEP